MAELHTLDYVGLTVYTLYLGGVVGGILLLLRLRGKRRLVGLVLLGEATAAMVLLTLMSSHYWPTGGDGIISLELRSLTTLVGSVLVPMGIGAVAILMVGYAVSRMVRGRHKIRGLVVPLVLLPLFFTVSTAALVTYTAQNRPVIAEPQDAGIEITSGFTVTIYSRGPAHIPTSIALGPDQRLYVSDYNGDIWSYTIGDGEINTATHYAGGFYEPVGLTWRGDTLYVAQHGKVTTIRDHDGRAGEMRDIITDLPTRLYPWHSNNGIVFGSDGRMYFSVGSTTDHDPEPVKYASSILSANPDGSDLRVYATGVRNPYRLAFNAVGDMFATDNGPDTLPETPGDRLIHVIEGADYGFPKYFNQPPPGSNVRGPVAVFPPHASADGIVFYHGRQFPQEYYDNAFVALWHRGEVVRVQLAKTPTGEYLSNVSLFINGLKNPLDMVVAPDGRLYMLDFKTSIIYRIAATESSTQSMTDRQASNSVHP